jgi:hypothetical protein
MTLPQSGRAVSHVTVNCPYKRCTRNAVCIRSFHHPKTSSSNPKSRNNSTCLSEEGAQVLTGVASALEAAVSNANYGRMRNSRMGQLTKFFSVQVAEASSSRSAPQPKSSVLFTPSIRLRR